MSTQRLKDSLLQNGILAKITQYVNVYDDIIIPKQISRDDLLQSAWQQTGESLKRALTEYGKNLKQTDR